MLWCLVFRILTNSVAPGGRLGFRVAEAVVGFLALGCFETLFWLKIEGSNMNVFLCFFYVFLCFLQMDEKRIMIESMNQWRMLNGLLSSHVNHVSMVSHGAFFFFSIVCLVILHMCHLFHVPKSSWSDTVPTWSIPRFLSSEEWNYPRMKEESIWCSIYQLVEPGILSVIFRKHTHRFPVMILYCVHFRGTNFLPVVFCIPGCFSSLRAFLRWFTEVSAAGKVVEGSCWGEFGWFGFMFHGYPWISD